MENTEYFTFSQKNQHTHSNRSYLIQKAIISLLSLHPFYKQEFCKQQQAEISKKTENKIKAKQHHKVELLVFENYLFSLPRFYFIALVEVC